MSFKSKLTIFAVIFALLAGVVGYWYWQRNIYSKEAVKLEILGKEQADLLEEIEYRVKYKNNGSVLLEDPKLIFEFPKHSVADSGVLRKEVVLEDIYPGQEKSHSFRGRLLGKEGETKEAKAWLSYRPKNLSAFYESSTTFTTQIKKVPITFDFDLASKIDSGKEASFRLNYFSNTNYPLSNLRIKIEYPDNFEFKEADPEGIGENEWEIGLLNKAEGGRIEIGGIIFGEVGEEKVFKAELGSWQQGEFVVLKTTARGIQIVQPSLYITQQINGNPEYTASPGEQLHYEIFFKNIGEEPLTDLTMLTTLQGSALDLNTIQTTNGEFEQGDNSIVWDWRRVRDLQFLPSQREGKIEFWVRLKETWEIKGVSDKNPVIKNRVYLSQVRQDFDNKVSSRLEILQKGYFEEEVFGNSGPVPPEVGETTTYTITWMAKNYFNDTDNVKVKATLPSYIQLTGKIFPEDQESRFTFDSASRELVWNLGDLLVGQGVLNAPPNISFQVAFTPQNWQSGETPTLINKARMSGQDQWTEKSISGEDSAINTTLPDDPTINFSKGVVQ